MNALTGIPTEAQFETVVLEQLREIGWSTAYGPDIDQDSETAERSDYREVVLRSRLRNEIRRLNPHLNNDEVEEAVSTTIAAESQSPLQENWRTYQLLTLGVPVETRGSDGSTRTIRAKLVDFDNPTSNDLLAVSQFRVEGPRRTRKADIVLFVNGLPLALVELKRAGAQASSLRGAYNQIDTYLADIPDLFAWNQVCVISDGIHARAGQFTGNWEHFAPWKTISGSLAPSGLPQYEVLIAGMLNPVHFLDLVLNFTVFSQDAGNINRLVAKYHQYWAVNRAVMATTEAMDGDGRAGVVWHTQGSGKSYEMLWYAGKIMRLPVMDNPTLVLLTDRNDLDDQLFDDTFASSLPGAPLPEPPVQVSSRNELKNLLTRRTSGGIIFSTIQKFALTSSERASGDSFPLLTDRTNVVVVVDEAHRSNYDFVDGFARHLRDGLPNATFIGFTGTPIESTDRSTTAVFGEYIDVYDLTQAVEDGATVKVFYEARLAQVKLPREALEDLDDAFAEAVSGTDESAQQQLKSKWTTVESIVGSSERVREIAADIVTHWEARREVIAGKAMIVTMSRRIAAALHDAIAEIRPEWITPDDATGRLKVVITGSAADEGSLQPHIRSREARRALKDRARDPDDELELVIVRDMWLTGFDSPSMNALYVDKPMRGANLMQAIARVNRTYKDKLGGLVIDYIGIAEDLRLALSDYTERDRANQEMGEDVRDRAIPAMLAEHAIVDALLHGSKWREVLASGGPKAFIDALAGALDQLLSFPTAEDGDSRSVVNRYIAHAGRFVRLYALCAGTPEAEQIKDDAAFFEATRAQLSKLQHGDRKTDHTGAAETAIRQIVSEVMAGVGVIDIYAEIGMSPPDLSLIDSDFIERFNGSERKNLRLEALRRLLADEIARIAERNVVIGREFSEMLADSILRYQNRTLDSAQVIQALVELAQQMTAEADRAEMLGLSDDELAFYDAIRTSTAAVRDLGDDKLRTIAQSLVTVVRRDAKTDWAAKEQVRAKLRASIKRLLRQHGYPPDEAEKAVATVIRQAEVIARSDRAPRSSLHG